MVFVSGVGRKGAKAPRRAAESVAAAAAMASSQVCYSPGPGFYDIEDEEIEEELAWANHGRANDASEEQQQQQRGNRRDKSGCGSNGGTGMAMEHEQQADEEDEPLQSRVQQDDAPPPGWSSSVSPQRSERSLIGDMRVEHKGALDYGICFLPLKAPIYQVTALNLLSCMHETQINYT